MTCGKNRLHTPHLAFFSSKAQCSRKIFLTRRSAPRGFNEDSFLRSLTPQGSFCHHDCCTPFCLDEARMRTASASYCSARTLHAHSDTGPEGNNILRRRVD